jgi:prepilin-type N-terminal cleavage/methylation domain-containing protein
MTRQNERGFTLLEAVVVFAIIGVFAAWVLPAMNDWLAAQRLRSGARAGADAFHLARSEAIRTSTNHVVYFAVGSPPAADPAATPLLDAAGEVAPVLVLKDDNANCRIDVGETTQAPIPLIDGIGWGVTEASAPVPTDAGGAPYGSGVTFHDAAGNDMTWMLFRPDGVPVGFAADATTCTLGQTGSGSGALYITDGNRDYAIAVSALGGARIHAWEEDSGQWTN